MDRRHFVKVCLGSTALAALPRTVRAEDFVDLPPARLVDAQGAPLRASRLPEDEAGVFYYPHRSIPCFLINLGRRATQAQALTLEGGARCDWPGGVGPRRNIVAYIAVCSHQLSYPDREGSEIRYAAERSEVAERAGMIVCCAHNSVFDPAAGARRLHGQAEFPLTAVRLAYDPRSDGLSATGIASMVIVERFFRVHKRRLIAEYGPGAYREPVGDSSLVLPFHRHTAAASSC